MSGEEKKVLDPFYAACGKTNWTQGRRRNKLIVWKSQELATNVCHKSDKDIAKKASQFEDKGRFR